MEYQSRFKSDFLDSLFEGLMELETQNEYYMLFEDLCTIHELQSLGQRFEVARMLNSGTTYQEISEKTGASTATISRVNRCLHYGAGGYPLVLERLEDK